MTLAGAGTAGAVSAAASAGVAVTTGTTGGFASAALLDCAGATTPGSSPSNLTDVDGTLFFTASDARGNALWRSGGTAGGTVLIKRLGSNGYDDYYNDSSMVGVDGTLFFTTEGKDGDYELWRSDGSKTGTVLVKRFASDGGEYGSDGPENLTAVGDTLFFTASDGVHGEELWRSNGTRAGTVPGQGHRQRRRVTATTSTAPRTSRRSETPCSSPPTTAVRGQEVWRSDGTRSGTVLVKDIRPGSYSSYARRLTAVGDSVFFQARDGVHGSRAVALGRHRGPGPQWSRTSGRVAATSDPEGLVAVGDTLFFSADDGTSGRDLWVSDGTAAGTVLVKDFESTGDDYDEYGLNEIAAGRRHRVLRCRRRHPRPRAVELRRHGGRHRHGQGHPARRLPQLSVPT